MSHGIYPFSRHLKAHKIPRPARDEGGQRNELAGDNPIMPEPDRTMAEWAASQRTPTMFIARLDVTRAMRQPHESIPRGNEL